MEEFWPADGRKEILKKDGVYIQYHGFRVGPFPNRNEASWYDGQVQEIIMGWIPKEYFAGRIFSTLDAWYVERWDTNDGPFKSMQDAWSYRVALYAGYREVIERAWENHTGTKAPEYSVKTTYPVDNLGEAYEQWAESGRKSKKATDDIIDVSVESEIRQFKEEHAETVRAIVAESGSGFGRMSESGRVHVNSEGKVVISGRDSENATDVEVEFCADSHCDCSKFMQATDVNFNAAKILGETRLVIPESLRGGSTFADSGWATDGDIQQWEKSRTEYDLKCGEDDANATDDFQAKQMRTLTEAISMVLTNYRTSEPKVQAEEVVDLLIDGGWVAE
jgi:hypothetical protein